LAQAPLRQQRLRLPAAAVRDSWNGDGGLRPHFRHMRAAAAILICLIAIPAQAQTGWKTLNVDIQKAVDSVSTERLETILRKLESFETRNTMSDQKSTTKGIGAARQWIFEQFTSYSPRLEVSFDTHILPKGGRIPSEVEIRNVVAVLPGTDPVGKNRRFIIGGHYDSISSANFSA